MSQDFVLESRSFKDTIRYGRYFSTVLGDNDVVILEGNLGGGKTTFVKGVVKALGSPVRVTSPSFVLLRVYRTKKFTVNHFDFYRLDKEEIRGLGVQEMIFSPKRVSIIEWGGIYAGELEKFIRIDFKYRGREKRSLSFSFKGYGRQSREKIKAALKR